MNLQSASLSDATRSPQSLTVVDRGRHYDIDTKGSLPYKVIRFLGSGSFSYVEMVEDLNTKQVFARKTFRKGTGSLVEIKARFLREVEIIHKLSNHRHVIGIFASYALRREFGIILEPVADGGDLGAILYDVHDSGKQPNESLRAILKRAFGCLASGLAFMHKESVRHKEDIKPANVLIHRGSVIYTDFGISLDSSKLDGSTTTGIPAALTRKFSAPEVTQHEARNTSSDIFSLGCIYVEILAVLEPTLIPSNILDGRYSENIDELQKIFRQAAVNDLDLMPLIPYCASMLQYEKENRITAGELLHRFTAAPDILNWGMRVLCEPCCEEALGLHSDASVQLIFLNAAARGKLTILRSLLRTGRCKFSAIDENGRTALSLAALEGRDEVVQLLMEYYGVLVNTMDIYAKTPLFYAAENGHESVVLLLLENGADIAAGDTNQQTALHVAAMNGHEAVVRLLLEKGADVNARDIERRTALHWAAQNGCGSVARLLLQKYANLNCKDRIGQTALLKATIGGHEELVRLLMDKGSDPKARDKKGQDALQHATERGFVVLLGLLQSQGHDCEKESITTNGSIVMQPPPLSSEPSRSSRSRNEIWKTSTESERKRIEEFWLGLGEEARFSLVKLDKKTTLRDIDIMRRSCSCTACLRNRDAINMELETLYDYHHEKLMAKAELFRSGDSLTIQGFILGGTGDVQDGSVGELRKVLDGLVDIKSKRVKSLKHGPQPADKGYNESDDDDDDDVDEDDYENGCDEDTRKGKERQLEKLAHERFQGIFDQIVYKQVLIAHRDFVAQERQRMLLEELEEESRLQEQQEQTKAKRNFNKRQRKQAKAREKGEVEKVI